MIGNEVATERVVTLMTPAEKAKLEDKARKAGVSVGEFVRRSVDSFDPEATEDLMQLAALAAELETSNRAAAEALDRALASVDGLRAQLERRI